MNRVLTIAILLFCVGVAGNLSSEEIIIEADRDSGFFDLAPDNNFGSHTHVPVGQANNERINRSVFDFDILGNLPDGATINSVTFQFEVSQQGGPQGQAGVNFDIHLVTRPWLEGTGTTDVGEPTGDGATWLNATDTELWTTPGGDFSATISGSVFVNGPSNYSISSAQLVNDIQAIVDGNLDNFGFLMKANTNVPGSAARVTSREGGISARLIIDIDGDVLLGDINLDGVVNLQDVSPFVALLTTGQFQAEGDINGDGVVSLTDVAPFVALLSGG